jgi:hypothetical protein
MATQKSIGKASRCAVLQLRHVLRCRPHASLVCEGIQPELLPQSSLVWNCKTISVKTLAAAAAASVAQPLTLRKRLLLRLWLLLL